MPKKPDLFYSVNPVKEGLAANLTQSLQTVWIIGAMACRHPVGADNGLTLEQDHFHDQCPALTQPAFATERSICSLPKNLF